MPQPEAAAFDPADTLPRSGASNRSFKSVSPGYGMAVSLRGDTPMRKFLKFNLLAIVSAETFAGMFLFSRISSCWQRFQKKPLSAFFFPPGFQPLGKGSARNLCQHIYLLPDFNLAAKVPPETFVSMFFSSRISTSRQRFRQKPLSACFSPHGFQPLGKGSARNLCRHIYLQNRYIKNGQKKGQSVHKAFIEGSQERDV